VLTPPALRHVKAHPEIQKTRQRAKAAVLRQLTPEAIQDEREIFEQMANGNTTFCTTFTFSGMEVLVGTTETACFLLCPRNRWVFQTLDLPLAKSASIISLRAHSSTGQIVLVASDGLLCSYYPVPSDPLEVSFGRFQWRTGPMANCALIFYTEIQPTVLFGPSRSKNGLEVSLAGNNMILLAHQDQLTVLDSDSSLQEAEMLWTTRLPSKIVTAQFSGDAHCIAIVLEPNPDDHDAADADGVHTLERDWEDGVTRGGTQQTNNAENCCVGILYKPGPFLVHSAPVKKLSFRGFGRETSQPLEDGDSPGNDLLLTVATDNTVQIFGQSNWKPLTEWTTSPQTRVDWILGKAAFTLGDLDARSSSASSRKKTGSRRPSETNLEGMERSEAANEQGSRRESHFTSIPTHSTLLSKAGAWICEVSCDGLFPSLRLSRLTYLKRGADDLSPTLFESVSGFLPANAIFSQYMFERAEDSATFSIEGLWPIWDPFTAESNPLSHDNVSHETLRGSAMAFLGLSSAQPSSHHPVGARGAFVDPQLSPTQCPPSELRLTISHPVHGLVTVLEYHLFGDKSLTSLELGLPSHSLLALRDIDILPSSRKNLQSDSTDYVGGRLVATLEEGKSINVTLRQPGTLSLLPTSWHPEDITSPNATEILANFKRVRDESLLPAPIAMRPFRIPKEFSELDDPFVLLKWWPDSGLVGCPPVLLAITKRGRASAFEVVTPLVTASSEICSSPLPPPGVSQAPLSSATNGGETSLADNSPLEYEVSIVPDPELGLGLRLESLDDGQPAIAGSFKKNPVTGGTLPAENTGSITLGDELLSANGIVLEDKTFDEIIGTVRDLGASSGPGYPIKLRFRRSSSRAGSAASTSDGSNRRTMEQMLGVNPENVQKLHSQNGSHKSTTSQLAATRGQETSDGARLSIASFVDPIPGVASALGSNGSGRNIVLMDCPTEGLNCSSEAIVASASGSSLVFAILALPRGPESKSEARKLKSVSFGNEDIASIQLLDRRDTEYFVSFIGIKGLVGLAIVSLDVRSNLHSARWVEITKLNTPIEPSLLFRAYSVSLFATLDQASTQFDSLKVWSASPGPGVVGFRPQANDTANFVSSCLITSEIVSSGNASNMILDFAFVKSGCFDASPWLVVFDTDTATVHHKQGGSDEWLPLTHLHYTQTRSSAEISVSSSFGVGGQPRDIFPHIIPSLREILPPRDERRFLVSDWHPEALLAYLCLGENGALHSLKHRLREVFLWMCQEGANITEDQALSKLLCAPMAPMEEKSKDEQRQNQQSSAFAIGGFNGTGPRHSRETAMLQDLQNLLGGHDQSANTSPGPQALEMPPMLRSSKTQERDLLWGIGEMILRPPEFEPVDLPGQLYIFSSSLLSTMLPFLDAKKKGKASRNKFVAPTVLRRSSSVNRGASEHVPSPQTACGPCLAALVSNSQEQILNWAKLSHQKFDWSCARRLRLPFWVRSDKSLARIAEEIGQEIFREKRDVMECAIFFIIARKMRTLRNLAATDQSISGKKFFDFITTHDFSSERGRRAADKNAFSLLRKCRYLVASAFFLLAEPPSLKSALETIVTKLNDVDLAFMVARLMESKELAPAPSMGTVFEGVLGGGGGYAGGGIQTPALIGPQGVPFSLWSPALGKATKALIVERLFAGSEDDGAFRAIQLVWMKKREEAAWWLPGFIVPSPGSQSGYKQSENIEARPFDKIESWENHQYGAIKRANDIVDWASTPLLLKEIGASARCRNAGTLVVARQFISKGIEIPSLWSLLVHLQSTKENPGGSSFQRDQEDSTPNNKSSSIFDSYDVPTTSTSGPIGGMMQSSTIDSYGTSKPASVAQTSQEGMQSSIFDNFDVSSTKPAAGLSGGGMQSSIYDSYGAPKPTKPTASTVQVGMQSSIFDQFDVPTTKPAPSATGSGDRGAQSSIFDSYDMPQATKHTVTPTAQTGMQSSIFDQFDVPTTKPASSSSGPSGGLQSSIFDSYDMPKATGASNNSVKCDKQSAAAHKTEDEQPDADIHLSIAIKSSPDWWDVWKDRLVLLATARRLVREVASVLGTFHGDPSDASVEDFYLQNAPFLPSGASEVLQVPCDAQGILARIRKSLRELTDTSGVDEALTVEFALEYLGGYENRHRVLFSTVLLAAIERSESAESIVRYASGFLMSQAGMFAIVFDDTSQRRKSRHQVASIHVRRLAARLSWQLEMCLWLHRGGGIQLSGVAFKEATVAVRMGVVLASWNRNPGAIEASIRCDPDTIVDEEEGMHLWRSLKRTASDRDWDKARKASSGGWEFFVDCRRSEATKILRESPTGSFVIRPHPNDHGVFTLSFKTNLVPGVDEPEAQAEDAPNESKAEPGTTAEPEGKPPRRGSSRPVKKDDIVQHAIVRLSDSGFRCGSFGPFTSLLDLLESVSESLPFELRFDLPPSNRVIREEGSQPSPNAVLFRKLALSHASSTASHAPNEEPPSTDGADASTFTTTRGEKLNERHRWFGVFLDLLVLTDIRRSLSSVAAARYDETDENIRGNRERGNGSDGLDENRRVADWIISPLLGWCRSVEVRAVEELAPYVSSSEISHVAQSKASMDVSERSIEMTLSSPVGITDSSGDTILRSMIQRDSGVEFSTLRLVDGGECSMVVLFSRSEAIEWLISSGTEHSEVDAIHRLEIMEKERVIEPVDFAQLPLKHRPSELEEGVRYRFVDPWEVEAVENRDGETRSAALGRQYFLGFGLGKIALACEADFRSLGGVPLLELWMSTKGGMVLSRALASVHPPWERAAGGDLQIRGGVVAEPEPFSNGIREHLYRNALFRRLDLPQRFLALVQVELLDLKNLTSPGGTLSLSVYALLRLKRRGSSGVLSNKTRTLDTASTTPVRLGKPTSVGPHAPASWGSVVRFRYPLPDDVAMDGSSCDIDREALFKGPPSVLQLTVYEKKLLVDHALGTADVDMDGLSAGGQVEEWVPLRSEKNGIHWFARIRLTLRFELMCLASQQMKNLASAAPSVGLQRIETLCQAGGAAAHEDHKRSISSPDLLQYLESMVY